MVKRILLVEGADDLHVLRALFAAHKVPQTFSIEPLDGIDPLLDHIPVRLKARNEDRLGVLLDADTDITARWNALRDRVHQQFAGKLPAIPEANGTIVELDQDLIFGAWLMPDNQVPGILEHFIRFLVPADDKLFEPVVKFIESLPREIRRCPDHREAKAHIHAWLALQDEPGKPLGQAVTAKYLDATASFTAPLIAWITSLFN